jgi:hypothetical protein
MLSGSFNITTPQGSGSFYSNLPITSSNLRINGPAVLADLFVSGVFGGTGGLNVSGNSELTGSLRVAGAAAFSSSVSGLSRVVSIVSNTASIDLSTGNFFTLGLPFATSTHIRPFNPLPGGETVNILISTSGSNTEVTFPTYVKQPSGSNYVPSQIVGNDILTLVAWSTQAVYINSVKNLV